MATCTLLVGTADSGVNPNTSGSFTPTSGALLVVLIGASATTDNTANVTGSGGMTFSLIKQGNRGGSASKLFAYASDSGAVNASQTVSVDMPVDPCTGTTIQVYEVTGMTNFGASALRQENGSGNQSSATTPEITFPASCLTGNPTIGFLCNDTSPAGITPPTGWTETGTTGDIGYSNPTSGAACCHRDSGFTGTVVTWAANSPSNYGCFMLELDASASAGQPTMRRHGMCPYTQRGPLGVPGLGYFKKMTSGLLVPSRKIFLPAFA